MARERGSGVTPPRVVELLKKEVSEKSILAVANATGLGLAAIGRYLKGVGEPTTASLQKLADYFGVSVAWLREEGIWRVKAHNLETVNKIRGMVEQEYSHIHALNVDSILQLNEEENYKVAEFLYENFK